VYALREFAPRAHALLLRRVRGGAERVRSAGLPPAHPAFAATR
jgi:hypothetical protein